MNQDKFSFKSENLVVDWIGFKFQYFDKVDQTKIAKYFFQLGFNSYQKSGKLANPVIESILVSSNNKFQVLFVNEAPYWKGTYVQFSGRNAAFLYNLMKLKLINMKVFDSAILGRFDLNYLRKNKTTDKICVYDFLENCQRNLKQTKKNSNFKKNSIGCILKIGTRRSNKFSRVYEIKNSLKFEHEMKGQFIKNYHALLIQNNFKEFEYKLSLHFLTYFGKLLALQYSYMDWLVLKLRPIRKGTILPCALNSDYIKSEIVADSKTLVGFIQFLNYAKKLEFEIEYLDQVSYRVISFKLQDFLQLQHKSTNQYQLEKTKYFLRELQTGIICTSFSNVHFQSLIAIPLVKFIKVHKFWVARIWIAEELFYYQYPFYLPDLFQQKLKKDQFEVFAHVFQIFTSPDIKKIFLVKQFFQNYPSSLSNRQKTKMKEYFIQSIKMFQHYDLIENKYQIIYDGLLLDTDILTSKNISDGFIIYEKLSI